MNYTEKYHLPQWEENDRIMRTDFNSAMAGLESGLNANAQAAAEAKSAAQTAQTAANTRPYKTGSYTGTGNDKTQSISVGFRPSFVIISGLKKASGGGDGEMYLFMAMTAGGVLTNAVKLYGSGFTVGNESGGYPLLNVEGRKYDYIAFR